LKIKSHSSKVAKEYLEVKKEALAFIQEELLFIILTITLSLEDQHPNAKVAMGKLFTERKSNFNYKILHFH